jgi:cell division protein FtsB
MFYKIKKNYFLFLLTFLMIYFLINLFDGKRGLFSYFEKKNLLINLQKKEVDLNKKIHDLEFKNSLLVDKIDLDYIETLIRKKFLYGKNKETLYIIKKNDS